MSFGSSSLSLGKPSASSKIPVSIETLKEFLSDFERYITCPTQRSFYPHSPIRNPVLASDGYIYEKDRFKEYYQEKLDQEVKYRNAYPHSRYNPLDHV